MMVTPSDAPVTTATPHFKIVNKLIQPDATVETVTVALKEIDDLTLTLMAEPESEAYHYHPWNLWKTIFEQILPHTAPIHQSKLVEFVIQLQKKTTLDPITGEPMRSGGELLWTELPYLGPTLSETWDDMSKFIIILSLFLNLMKMLIQLEIGPWDPQLSAYDQNRWKNQSAFVAQLFPVNGFFHDLPMFGLFTFCQAFENIPSIKGIVNDTAVGAACWWLVYAVDKLWAEVSSGRGWEGLQGAGGFNYQDRPWKGYNLERWSVWEQGLLDALPASENEKTKKLFQDALAQMKRVVPDE